MIDFHCHLDLFPDPAEVAERCEDKGIYVLSVTTTPSAWHGTRKLERPRIRTALGLHPQLANQRCSELGLFDELLSETRYVGEVGLDGAPPFRTHWREQLQVFDHILDACSRAGGRILSIHSRRAAKTVLDCVEAVPQAGTFILHWFSGSPHDLSRAVALGCWFSVGPAMLAGKKGRALATVLPRDRVLTETDGPFARIGDKAAMPWDAALAERKLALLWNMSAVETAALLRENLRCLVSQGDPEPE